jgi:hypothetical protein
MRTNTRMIWMLTAMAPAVQDQGEHRDALFSEGAGQIAAPAALRF